MMSAAEHDSQAVDAGGKAKHLSLPWRDSPGQTFSRALNLSGVTASSLARAWGSNQSLPSQISVGQRQLTLERIVMSPPGFIRAIAGVLSAIADERDARAPAPAATPGVLFLTIAVAHADLARELRECTIAGDWSELAKRRIARAAGEVSNAAQAIARAMSRR